MNGARASLVTALILSLGAAGGLGYWASQLLKERNAREAELIEARNLSDEAEIAHDDALAALKGRHEVAIDALNADFDKRLDALEKRQSQRLDQAYAQFNTLVGESGEALQYIAALEKRVHERQLDASVEAEKLGSLAAALSLIADSYSEPMAEFAAVAESFAQQANSSSVQKPDPKLRGLKHLFSRNYREGEKAYRDDQVRRRAFQQAHNQIKSAYTRAQTRMAGQAERLRAQSKAIYAMADKETLTEKDLEEFFKTSRKVLSTHQQMLDFEPDLPAPSGAKP